MVNIPGWTPDLERSFKQVLFRFLEEIQCTKAALYLLAEDGSYALVTQYGFGRRDLLAAEFRPDHPLVVKARQLEAKAAAFNSPSELKGVEGYLEGAGTKRLLLAPLWAGSKVVGFADARDRGRNRAFTDADAVTAQAIARELADSVARFQVFPELELELAAEPGATSGGGEAVGHTVVAGAVLDEVGLHGVLEAAHEIGGQPRISGVAVTVVEGGSAATVLWLPEAPAEVDRAAVLRHQADVLRVQRLPVPEAAAWAVELRVLERGAAGAAAQVIGSDLLLGLGTWALIGSVVGEAGSTAAADGVARLRRVATRSHEGSRLRHARRRLARSLLDQGTPRIPELVEHSESVSRLAWTLALELGEPASVVEEVAVAGLVHDIGMRELGGTDLYRRSDVGEDERSVYRQHVLAGEGQLLAAGLDGVAAAVRHHHERWDGTGYPDRLAGESIPLVSRVVHVAEVFDVLTSSFSYRRAVSAGQALTVVRAAAGRQFDPAVVEALGRVVG